MKIYDKKVSKFQILIYKVRADLWGFDEFSPLLLDTDVSLTYSVFITMGDRWRLVMSLKANRGIKLQLDSTPSYY